jgi:hypothetical protein
VRCLGDQLGQQWRRADHLLEIIQHQEQLLRPQERHEQFTRTARSILAQPECASHRRGDWEGITQRRQIDKDDAIRIRGTKPMGDRQRETRLSNTAGAGERHEANALALEQIGDLGHVPFPPDQGRRRLRQRECSRRTSGRLSVAVRGSLASRAGNKDPAVRRFKFERIRQQADGFGPW